MIRQREEIIAALVAYIGKQGSVRSPDLVTEFGIPPGTTEAADELLAPKVADGTLMSCKVERPGLPVIFEYRQSLAGGGSVAVISAMQRRQAEVRKRVALDALRKAHDAKKHNKTEGLAAERGAELGRIAKPARQEPVPKVHGSVAAPAPRRGRPRGPAPASVAIRAREPTHPTLRKFELRDAFAEMTVGDCRDFVGYTRAALYNGAQLAGHRLIVIALECGFRTVIAERRHD